MTLLRRTPPKDRPEWDEIQRIINGNLGIGSPTGPDNGNLNGNWSGSPFATPGAPDTEFAVTHNLNRIPVGYWVVRQDKAASFYDSGTAWTTTKIFLKCSVATVTISIYVF